MMAPAAMASDLRAHLAVCEELLLLAERENQLLRLPGSSPHFEFYQRRKALLPGLDASLSQLKEHRINWQRLRPEERLHAPDVASLIRLCQDLIMKILVLDRENEQLLLKRGLLPASMLAGRQPPHYAAAVYRRHGSH
jgi:hypothetical protein